MQTTRTKPQLTQNALTVLRRRYLAKSGSGEVTETPEEMFWRVASNVASAESFYGGSQDEWVSRFYDIMANLEFLPNSPTLMNAGRELQQLSACFVLPVEDSMESIFESIKNTALIHKSGGGTGFSFSKLRPKDDIVLSTGGVASGPISFMKVFNAATDAVKQGGTRRGANMAILSVDHPDIIEFITVKKDRDALTNFNLSVAATDKFMNAVIAGTDYDLVNVRTGQVVKSLPARDVFDLIIEMAWDNGEPGLVFMDRINAANPLPKIGRIESTNPCGEQPLLPYEACNLGSINLARMVATGNGAARVDYDKLREIVHCAVRFLDDVIDVNRYPLPIIADRTRANRKIGLGVMGFADMLISLGIPYNSPDALRLGEDIMRFILKESREASTQLAEQRGAFPNFPNSVYAERGEKPLRNATTTTIAPTGTLSIIANCSSGIEPIFAVAYFRTILDNERMVEVHPRFLEQAKSEGFYSEDLMSDIATKGSVFGVEGVPEAVQRVFICAHDVTAEYHVRMQSAFQRSTDNAVSKTVNLSHSATKADVKRILLMSYEEGCKGITIYRDGSRDSQVLSTAGSAGTAVAQVPTPGPIIPRDRPQLTFGTTEKATTGCGNIYVTVNSDEKGICEVFSQMGKSGGCAQAQSEAVCRLISLALRSGVDTESVVRQLKGIRCPSIAWREGGVVLSCPDAISKVLEARLQNGKSSGGHHSDDHAEQMALPMDTRNLVGQCPDCSNLLTYMDGCSVCRECGYSKCG